MDEWLGHQLEIKSCIWVDPISSPWSCLKIVNRSASFQLGFLRPLYLLKGNILSFRLSGLPMNYNERVKR